MSTEQNARILIVDDEPFIREICADLLRLEYADKCQYARVDPFSRSTLRTLGIDTAQAPSEEPSRQASEEQLCCAVSEASSGSEAIESVKKGLTQATPYDLVICDIRMPGMDGVTTAEHLIALDSQIEIIFASAFSQYEEADIRRRIGKQVGFIQKPYDMAVFVETVGSYLRQIAERKDKRRLQLDDAQGTRKMLRSDDSLSESKS